MIRYGVKLARGANDAGDGENGEVDPPGASFDAVAHGDV